MKAFYIKTGDGLFLGDDEAIFIFMNRQSAQARLDITDAEPQEKMRIVEITVEEIH
jgi:hypothetical protein